MIRIRTKTTAVIFNPAEQTMEDYSAALDFFKAMISADDVVSVTASGDHYREIVMGFANLPKAGPEYPNAAFTWTSVFAETIVANILSSLDNGDSFIIKQVEDVNEYAGQRWYGSNG